MTCVFIGPKRAAPGRNQTCLRFTYKETSHYSTCIKSNMHFNSQECIIYTYTHTTTEMNKEQNGSVLSKWTQVSSKLTPQHRSTSNT